MRKILALLLVLCMVLSLSACKSKEVKNTEALITAIGEVTLDSEAAIVAAEDAYTALPAEDQAEVENLAELTAARAAYDTMAAAADVETLITAIGEVTLDSEAAIAAAEEAYNALTEESKALVANAADLPAARTAYEGAVAFAYQEKVMSLVGAWYNEVIGNQVWPNGLEDTDCEPRYVSDFGVIAEELWLNEDGSFSIYDATGSWILSEDLSTVTLTLENEEAALTSELAVVEEDGFTKLLGELFENKFFAYVKEEDYQAAFDAKYVAVELNDSNFRDYIGECEFMGTTTTSDGTLYLYFYPSEAYDDGLVYMGCNCYLRETATYSSGAVHPIDMYFPVMSGSYEQVTSAKWNGNASGYMFYVKADHVADNYINDEGYRVLELTDGTTMVFNGYWTYYNIFWSVVDAEYTDYIY